MKQKWTPTQVAALAVMGLLALLGAWLFIASAFAVIREFVVQDPPVPLPDNGRAAFLGVIGAIVSIVSVTFGVGLAQKDRSGDYYDDDPVDFAEDDADELGDDIGQPNKSGTPPQQWEEG